MTPRAFVHESRHVCVRYRTFSASCALAGAFWGSCGTCRRKCSRTTLADSAAAPPRKAGGGRTKAAATSAQAMRGRAIAATRRPFSMEVFPSSVQRASLMRATISLAGSRVRSRLLQRPPAHAAQGLLTRSELAVQRAVAAVVKCARSLLVAGTKGNEFSESSLVTEAAAAARARRS